VCYGEFIECLAIKGNVPMKHVVLAGDSIFDNAPYVGDGPEVIKQVQSPLLPMGWTATLKARDGDLIADVEGQIATLPMDASHLVVSVGGNDAPYRGDGAPRTCALRV
jgi:hypothetical protein